MCSNRGLKGRPGSFNLIGKVGFVSHVIDPPRTHSARFAGQVAAISPQAPRRMTETLACLQWGIGASNFGNLAEFNHLGSWFCSSRSSSAKTWSPTASVAISWRHTSASDWPLAVSGPWSGQLARHLHPTAQRWKFATDSISSMACKGAKEADLA